jgi:hypothetical protein
MLYEEMLKDEYMVEYCHRIKEKTNLYLLQTYKVESNIWLGFYLTHFRKKVSEDITPLFKYTYIFYKYHDSFRLTELPSDGVKLNEN